MKSRMGKVHAARVLDIAADLERMGALTTHIAEAVLRRHPALVVPPETHMASGDDPGSCHSEWVCDWHRTHRTERKDMTEHNTETGTVTGTKDKDYNLIWFTEASLSNALRMERYVGDAERDGDTELAEFFRRAQAESRKGAEQGKALLAARLREIV